MPDVAPGNVLLDVWRRTTKPLRWGEALWRSTRIPVGATPREEIWSFGKTTVYHYVPRKPAEERYPVPLLIVYAIVNRPFILDLRPGYSFVEHMLDEGFDIYLVDWGKPRS